MGRAARHINGHVIMYAGHITESMKFATDLTRARRLVQDEYNKKNGITPTGIQKAIMEGLKTSDEETDKEKEKEVLSLFKRAEMYPVLEKDAQKLLQKEIELQMELYSEMLEFEKAAECRDLLIKLREKK